MKKRYHATIGLLLAIILSAALLFSCAQQKAPVSEVLNPPPIIPQYTKMDSYGYVLPDTTVNWILVRDNFTGLVWEVKRNRDGVKNYADPHDADNTYTWYDHNLEESTGAAGVNQEGMDTEDFIASLNASRLGGYTDWRLPTNEEFWTLSELGRNTLALNPAYFPTIMNSFYWTNETDKLQPNHAWGVSMGSGYGSFRHKGNPGYAMAVRGQIRKEWYEQFHPKTSN